MSAKPAIFPDERSDAERFDPILHRGHLDPSRIPGYSEIVQANDIAKADDLYFREQNKGTTKEDIYRQVGAMPAQLDVEFAWLPVSNGQGGESSHVARQLDRYRNQEGYRLATDEDLASRGYQFPPTARRAEDGTIRRGPDVALYVRSGEVARKWEAFKIEQQREIQGDQTSTLQTGDATARAWSNEVARETMTVKH